jgi:transcriptional antiterminator Rof (Rho-off)
MRNCILLNLNLIRSSGYLSSIMQTKHYNPVSCQLHSELELAIMHKSCIKLKLEHSSCIIKPHDIITENNKGEFLLGIDQNGLVMKIRLDKIISWDLTVETKS